MAQLVLVIIIVTLAVAAAAVKLYRFFRPSPSSDSCTPDACATCPYRSREQCDK